jgi:hypothetical protein
MSIIRRFKDRRGKPRRKDTHKMVLTYTMGEDVEKKSKLKPVYTFTSYIQFINAWIKLHKDVFGDVKITSNQGKNKEIVTIYGSEFSMDVIRVYLDPPEDRGKVDRILRKSWNGSLTIEVSEIEVNVK